MSNDAPVPHEFAAWQVEGRSPLILYSTDLMCRLESEARRAFESFPSGGQEVGGILYGIADGDEIRITAARPVTCSFSQGPDFKLSSNDEVILRYQLENGVNDPELTDLQVVGWYHSHTRADIALSKEDVRLWDRFFGEPWQVALLLHPSADLPTTAGFFFRPKRGKAVVDRSLLEFEIGPPPAGPRLVEPEQAAEPMPAPTFGLLDDDYGPPDPPPDEMLDLPDARRRTTRFLWRVAGASLVLVVATAGYLWWHGDFTAPRPRQNLTVRLVEENGELHAIWDSRSPAVRSAAGGTLEVQDGTNRITFPVTPALLRTASWPISRVTGDVRVRLKLTPPATASGVEPAVGVAHFVGDPPAQASDSGAGDAKQAAVAILQEQLSELMKSNADLSTQAATLRDQLQQRDLAAAGPATAQPPPAQPPKTVPPPATAAPPLTARATPPTTTVPASPNPQQPAPDPGIFPTAPPSRPVTLPPVTPPKPQGYTGARSGRVIWTGVLRSNEVLNIAGRTASTGRISGAFPGVPVRITVYPAKLAGDGFEVYSADTRHQGGSVSERPSAQNGWLPTKFVYDPAKAGALQILSSPTGADAKVQLRNSGQPLDAIFIEWQVVQ